MQARILWSLLWRSVLLFPVGVFVAFAVAAFPVLMVLLPIWAGLFFIEGSWMCGFVTLAVMVPVMGARHWLVGRIIGAHDPNGFL